MSIFISLCLQEKDRGVSGSLRSSFNHTVITAKERAGGGGGGKKGEELGRPGWEESGPRRKRWGPEQLSLLKCVSVPEAARLAQIEQFGRIEGIRHPQLGAVGGGGDAG